MAPGGVEPPHADSKFLEKACSQAHSVLTGALRFSQFCRISAVRDTVRDIVSSSERTTLPPRSGLRTRRVPARHRASGCNRHWPGLASAGVGSARTAARRTRRGFASAAPAGPSSRAPSRPARGPQDGDGRLLRRRRARRRSASGSTRRRCGATMGRYFEEIRPIVERHGGTVEKFIGDAVMAVFGVPRRARGRRAARGARGGRDPRAAAALGEELSVALSFRTGVNTGEVVAGEGETLVTGDAVNVAARLEQAAAPGEILIGAATLALVRDAVDGRARRAAGAEGEARAGRGVPARCRGPDGGRVRATSRRAARRPGARAAAARWPTSSASCRSAPATCSRCSGRPAPASRGSSRSSSRARARRARRSARPLPALRRGHHLLAARRDPARDRRRARRRDRQSRRPRRSSPSGSCSRRAPPIGRRSSCSTTSSGPSRLPRPDRARRRLVARRPDLPALRRAAGAARASGRAGAAAS